ncbi:MAG: SHOCT domain-containing protein [Clostridiaceae bacterium]
MYNWWPGNNPNSWIGMIIGIIIFVAAIIVLIVLLLRPRHTDNYKDNYRESQDSSMRILEERFAKGEIDEEEYKKRKEILKKL